VQRLALTLTALTLSFAALTALVPAAARADEQFGSRGGLGFGKRIEENSEEMIVELTLDSDMLIGPARHNAFRFGLAGEGRTTDLHSIEGAGGLSLLIPLPISMSMQITGLVGLAWRAGDAPDGWMGIGKTTLGYRGYNYHGWYSYGLNLYFSGRKQLNDDYLVEFSGGVQVDMLFTTVIPFLAIKNALTKGDPHED
jgi:hypothetical protein